MKKLLLTAALALVSLGLYAQGTVNFQNAAASAVTDATLGGARVSPTNTPAATAIHAALYWAPASDPLNFTQLGNSIQVGTAIAGVFIGGTRSTGPATPGGTPAQFQVRAWEVAYGSTYETAIAAANMNGRPAKRGNSNTITVLTGNPGGTPATTQGQLTASGLQGFAVDVPEPSVIALGVIGAGALLLLRRRK